LSGSTTPAVVRVLDFLEANGTAYMVMALVEGETLNKRLMREQRLAPEVIERLLFPLLDGLEQVHAAGFLHRDIKPANIMIDPHDRPTLIDFGASRAAMAGRSTTLTAIFTPGYAAAEQFVSSKQGPWTDIYGLAATLYHAITGRIPPSAIERIMQDAYQPLSDLRPSGYAPGTRRHRCRDGCPCGRQTPDHRGMAAHAAARRPASDADRAQAGFGGARGAQDQKRRHHNQGSARGGCSGQRAWFCWPEVATWLGWRTRPRP
jgi:Serine/threonine protein kinase